MAHKIAFARHLRRNATPAERRLWRLLRARRLAHWKFRRRHPLGPYIVDFVCIDARLVVEVDGGQHADSVRDVRRTAWLEGQGYSVVRFWNNDVLMNSEGVLEVILQELELPR